MDEGRRGPAIVWYGFAAVLIFAALHAWYSLATFGALPISGRPSLSASGWSREADPFTRGFFAGAALYGFGFAIGVAALMIAVGAPDRPSTTAEARKRLRLLAAAALGAALVPVVIVAGRSLVLEP